MPGNKKLVDQKSFAKKLFVDIWVFFYQKNSLRELNVELTPDELWVLEVYFNQWAFKFRPHDKNSVYHELSKFRFWEGEQIINSLINKRVLSESPDKSKVRWTDYGFELFCYAEKQQKEWEDQPIARVKTEKQDEILIKQGEFFRGFWVVRQILLGASKSIYVQDPYLGPDLFSIFEELDNAICIKILTSNKKYKEKTVQF